MRNISYKACKDSQNTHFVFNNFIRKSWSLWENVEKYGRGRHATYIQHGACALHAG